ncbi:MAG: type 1 glutamine amidotransferase [Phycisphaerales bacterium]|nr:MAG: type 1 glutamine amidotransferase [Phycisphaerales bacterium]
MRERGIDHDVVHAYRPDVTFAPVAAYDAFFVGGTPVSACAVDDHEFLRLELEYLRQILDAGKPFFGICCGGQLLARLLGAGVRKNPVMEIGCYDVELTKAGTNDPLLRGFPLRFPVFQWHGDTFDVPPDASLLVQGKACHNQLIRKGTAVALHFHLEVTAANAARWAEVYANELESVSKNKNTVVQECRRHEERMGKLCGLLLDNYLALIR